MRQVTAFLTLCPKSSRSTARIVPEQRRRGLFTVNVYNATLDVVAEFQTAELRAHGGGRPYRRLVGRSP